VTLAERLLPAVEALANGPDHDVAAMHAFELGIRIEAERLLAAPYSAELLRLIADVYESEALRFLTAMQIYDPQHELVQAHANGRLLRSQASAVSDAVRATLALRKLLDEERVMENHMPSSPSSDATDEWSSTNHSRTTSLCLERASVQAQLPTIAAALWRLTILDIEGTLRRVCRRVLRDTSQNFSARTARAAALRVAAKIMQESADAHPTAPMGSPGEDEELLRRRVVECVTQLLGGNRDDDDVSGVAAAAAAAAEAAASAAAAATEPPCGRDED
jgi:hypothetical protein